MTEAENRNPQQTEYQLAAGVAKHVDLKHVFATQVSGALKVPLGEARDALQSGKADAKVAWNPSFQLNEADLLLKVRADYVISVSFGKNGENEPKELVTIGATFELEYKLDSLPPEKDSWQPLFKAFATVNGMYNSWPYLREFVQSAFGRMTLPPFVLPLFKPQLVTGWESSISKAALAKNTAASPQ